MTNRVPPAEINVLTWPTRSDTTVVAIAARPVPEPNCTSAIRLFDPAQITKSSVPVTVVVVV